MNFRALIQSLAPRVLIVAILATFGISLYRHYFGEGLVTQVVYPVNVLLWALAIVCGLLMNKFRLDSALESNPSQRDAIVTSRWVLGAGVLIGILPVPWVLLISTIVDRSSGIGAALVIGPAMLFAVVAAILIFYRSFVLIGVHLGAHQKHRG